MPSNVTGINQK